MALLEEFEPPSNDEDKDNKIKLTFKYNRLIKDALFRLTIISTDFIKLLNIFVSALKSFIQEGKYLPHIAMGVLAMIVAISNINQKYIAKAYYQDIVSVNPDVTISVAQSVDPYIPVVKNGSDSVQKAISASAISDGFLSNNSSVATEVTSREEPSVLPNNESTTIKYTVQNGDTLSGLGMKFDLKIATIKYVNNIDNENVIKPGTVLKIPPKGYTVPQSLIAQQEKKKAQLAAAQRNTVTRSSSSSRATGSAQKVSTAPGSKANGYPYGWCTYYVATKRYVPTSWGNAKNWLNSARNAGYATGSEPAVGAIMVTSESGWGHVAYVESVDGSSITVSEMNYSGWGVVDRRSISIHSGVIRGYVY